MDPNLAIDAPLQNRPGVPREKIPPEPIAPVPRSALARDGAVEILVEPTRGITPVFGTRNAPHGLSGVVRRLAYRFPDYRVRRWLLLLLADRIDVREAQIGRMVKSPLAWAVVLGMGLLGMRLRAVARRRPHLS